MWFVKKIERPQLSESQKKQAFVSDVLARVNALPATVWRQSGDSYHATSENGATVCVSLKRGGLDGSDRYCLKVDDEEIAQCEIWGSSPLEKNGREDVINLFRNIEKKVVQSKADRLKSSNNSRGTGTGPKATAKEVEEEKRRRDVLRRL